MFICKIGNAEISEKEKISGGKIGIFGEAEL
jgi:hypothetical protein